MSGRMLSGKLLILDNGITLSFASSYLKVFLNFKPLVSDYRAVDHQWDGNLFATAGAQLDIWDHNRYSSPFISLGTFFSLLYILLVLNLISGITTGIHRHSFHMALSFPYYILKLFFFIFFCRSQPVSSYEWGTDSVISVRFNPGEPNVLATSARYA